MINFEVGDYDLKMVWCVYKVGDVVCVFDILYVKGRCRELSFIWKGFGIVIWKYFDYVYEVKFK